MSNEVVLEAQSRVNLGTSNAGRIRREGKVPAVVYGHGMDPVSITVDARLLRLALRGEAGLNALITLNLDGKSHLALVREPQVDSVKGTLQHVDFLVVNRNEQVTAEVPLSLVGESEGVKRGGGVLEHQLFTLTVNATPDKIPSSIEVDISHLDVGDSLHVRDIKLPEGVTTDIDPETAVLLVDVPRAVVATAVADEAAALEAEAVAAAPAAEAPAEG